MAEDYDEIARTGGGKVTTEVDPDAVVDDPSPADSHVVDPLPGVAADVDGDGAPAPTDGAGPGADTALREGEAGAPVDYDEGDPVVDDLVAQTMGEVTEATETQQARDDYPAQTEDPEPDAASSSDVADLSGTVPAPPGPDGEPVAMPEGAERGAGAGGGAVALEAAQELTLGAEESESLEEQEADDFDDLLAATGGTSADDDGVEIDLGQIGSSAHDDVAVVEEERAAESQDATTALASDDEGKAVPVTPAPRRRGLELTRLPGDFFVVHTYAGYEAKVKANLESRITSMNMEDRIFDVIIPTEDAVEIKSGKKQEVKRKVFPGYVLVRMDLDDDSWYVVKNTPAVTGFVGPPGARPVPLSITEVEQILREPEEGETVAPSVEFETGENIRVTSGPFADFTGTISEISPDASKIKVLVSIFGRETPVELGFDQVAKL